MQLTPAFVYLLLAIYPLGVLAAPVYESPAFTHAAPRSEPHGPLTHGLQTSTYTTPTNGPTSNQHYTSSTASSSASHALPPLPPCGECTARIQGKVYGDAAWLLFAGCLTIMGGLTVGTCWIARSTRNKGRDRIPVRQSERKSGGESGRESEDEWVDVRDYADEDTDSDDLASEEKMFY